MPLVISAPGGGTKETIKELENIFETNDLCKKVVAEMQKTILMDSETEQNTELYFTWHSTKLKATLQKAHK